MISYPDQCHSLQLNSVGTSPTECQSILLRIRNLLKILFNTHFIVINSAEYSVSNLKLLHSRNLVGNQIIKLSSTAYKHFIVATHTCMSVSIKHQHSTEHSSKYKAINFGRNCNIMNKHPEDHR
jgi:hypothetical protein